MQPLTTAIVVAGCIMATIHPSRGADHWVNIPGRAISVALDEDLTLSVYQGSPRQLAWQSRRSAPPTARVAVEGKADPVAVPLADAAERKVQDTVLDGQQGRRLTLRGFGAVDVELALVLAVNDRDEVLLQVEQAGGRDKVQSIGGLYDWQLEPASDAYVVFPRGSGYLIRADQAEPVELSGFIGSAHTLPLFALVRGDRTFYQIVETWWDAQVSVRHQPGEHTALALDWEASLGTLSYPRQVRYCFAQKLDHVGVAKAYRRYLVDRGQFRTLKQRAETLPALPRYLRGIEYRWVHWEPDQTAKILANIRHFQEAGLPITFFYPKWPSQGYGRSDSFDAGWQGYLHPDPVPGGWPAAVDLLERVHALDCPVKRMLTPHGHHADAPGYDPSRASGVGFPALSDRYALQMIKEVFDFLERKQFRFESLYFDGSTAYDGHHEHQSAEGPVTRRQTYEAQLDQFRETRRRGMVPGGELARFWSVAECDFFFFTDWARDRLREGEPVPLVPLVFHDCYGAHFSGGGYYNEGTHDWYEDRHPRLYELMYAAMPSYNWLPGGSRPIQAEDWGTEKMNRRLRWLRKWHAYYQSICYVEMTDHRFLDPGRKLQRIKFANGVAAEFDLERGLYRVHGVAGFTGDWEQPEKIER